MRIFFVCLSLVVLAPTSAYAWGLSSHAQLTKHMQDALPAQSCLRQWTESLQTSSFQRRSGDPDEWRETDPDEGPRHFLDVDVHHPAKDYPRDWPAVYELYGRRAEGYGLVPWHVESLYAELVEAFAAQNTSKLKQLLPWFSHYVMDAFSPLHNTINYDPNDLHYRYEDLMFDTSNNLAVIMDMSEGYVGLAGRAHPKHHLFDIIIVGTELVNDIIETDNDAIVGQSYYVGSFFNDNKDMTARRFGDGITLFSSLLASAWVDAGSPALSGMPEGCDMSVPQGTVVLAGFPVPGGFTYVEPKAEPESSGCNALGIDTAWMVLVTLGLLARRRTRYSSSAC